MEKYYDVKMEAGWEIAGVFHRDGKVHVKLWHPTEPSQTYPFSQFVEWNVVHPSRRMKVVQKPVTIEP